MVRRKQQPDTVEPIEVVTPLDVVGRGGVLSFSVLGLVVPGTNLVVGVRFDGERAQIADGEPVLSNDERVVTGLGQFVVPGLVFVLGGPAPLEKGNVQSEARSHEEQKDGRQQR